MSSESKRKPLGPGAEEKQKQQERSRRTIRRVLHCIDKYRAAVLLSLLLAVVTVALTLYVPILTGQAVDRIVSQGLVDYEGLVRILAKILAAMALTAVSQWLMNHINNIITYRVVKDIRTQAFDHVERLPLRYIDAHPSGDIISRIVADVDQFSEGLLMGFTQFFTGVMTIGGTLLFMLSINPLITLVVVLLTPLSLVVAGFIAKKTFDMFRLQSETRGALTTLTNEMLGNMKVVQAFGYQREAEKRFDEINRRLTGYSLRATFFSSITNPATRFVNSMVYAAVGIAGAWGVIRGLLTVGQLTSFLSYANQYTKPFNEISGVVTELQNALACAGRVFDLIDEETIPEEAPGTEALGDVKGQVDLENVSVNCSAPSGWTVTYELEDNMIESIPAGSTTEVIAHVKPSSDAITGDYAATFTAKTDEASDSAEFRISVKTQTIWGFVAIVIILGVAGGLSYVFKKYGRR